MSSNVVDGWDLFMHFKAPPPPVCVLEDPVIKGNQDFVFVCSGQ